MSEIEQIISEKVSTAIEKAVEKAIEKYDSQIICGVSNICKFLQISRNTFLSAYHKGDYKKAVNKIGRMFYLRPSLLFS